MLPCAYEERLLNDSHNMRLTGPAPSPSPYFVPGLPPVILIELRQALISYQDDHMLLLTHSRRQCLRWYRGAVSNEIGELRGDGGQGGGDALAGVDGNGGGGALLGRGRGGGGGVRRGGDDVREQRVLRAGTRGL